MTESTRPLAVVTGASSGIGRELARLCAENGYDLVIAADEPEIQTAADELRACGVDVEPVQVDLAMADGVNKVLECCDGRPVELLLANAGHGLGGAFLDQDFDAARHVIATNITGTLFLVREIALGMRERHTGRILFTGSIAGFMPGSFQAVYNGTKAFIDSFSYALRNELKDSGVTVTCLMPGATDTNFFERADMLDTKIGSGHKSDPAEVAKTGFDAMMKGEGGVIAGLKNKLQVAAATHMGKEAAAQMHRLQAEPGTGKSHGGESSNEGGQTAAREPADDVPATSSEISNETETVAASQDTMAPEMSVAEEDRHHHA